MAQGSNPWGAAEGAGRQAFWVRLADIIKHEDLVLPLSGRSNRSTGDTSGPADIEPLLKVVVAEAQRATVASGAAIALLDGSEFFCRAASGTTAPVVGSRLDGRSGLSGQCIRSGMPVRCDETEFDPRANAAACRELGIRSVLAVPVLSAGAAVGVLEVFSPKPAAFSDAHTNVLQALAERVVPPNSKLRQAAVASIGEPRREMAAVAAPRLAPAKASSPVASARRSASVRVNLRASWLRRRPWMLAAGVVLLAGAVVSVALHTSAAKSRLQTTVSAAGPAEGKIESEAS